MDAGGRASFCQTRSAFEWSLQAEGVGGNKSTRWQLLLMLYDGLQVFDKMSQMFPQMGGGPEAAGSS